MKAKELFNACINARALLRKQDPQTLHYTYPSEFALGPFGVRLNEDEEEDFIFTFKVFVGSPVIVRGIAQANGSGVRYDWVVPPTPVQEMKLRLYL